MTAFRVGLWALVCPVALAGQAPRPTAPPQPPPYRGFTPGLSYRAFVERARVLADGDVVRCQTSTHTAQLMECAVAIRDPRDGARFYLSAHFVEGRAAMIALFDSAGFGDARGVPLVDRTKRDLTQVFGRPHPLDRAAWQWSYGRRVVRFSWRGRESARWVSITLTDNDVMDRIASYMKPPLRGKT
jgi:hypothetical protein